MAINITEPRLGVALTKCFFCNESNEIVLNSVLTERHAAAVDEMDGKVINMRPCNKCKALMKKGVILITIDEEKSDYGWNIPPKVEGMERNGQYVTVNEGWIPNPYRSGGWFVVTDEFIRRAINPAEMANRAIKHRWMFIAHKAAKMMGLFEAAPVEAEN